MSSNRLPLRACGPVASVAVLAAALLAAPAARATTLVAPSLDEMVQSADAVVVGRVVGAESVKVGRALYTRYRVAVDEAMLGAASGAELSVVVPGGVDRSGPHPIRHSVVDAPVLLPDRPVALLLTRGSATGAQDHQILGFNRGALALTEDGARGRLGAGPTPPRSEALRTRLRQLVAVRAGGAARLQAAPQQAQQPKLPRGLDATTAPAGQ